MSKGAEIRERLALVRPIWRVGGPGGRDVRWNDASTSAIRLIDVVGRFACPFDGIFTRQFVQHAALQDEILVEIQERAKL